jgi:hypothetical protein
LERPAENRESTTPNRPQGAFQRESVDSQSPSGEQADSGEQRERSDQSSDEQSNRRDRFRMAQRPPFVRGDEQKPGRKDPLDRNGSTQREHVCSGRYDEEANGLPKKEYSKCDETATNDQSEYTTKEQTGSTRR